MSKSFIVSASIWVADMGEQVSFSSMFSYDAAILGSEGVWIDKQEEGFLRLHALFPVGKEFSIAQYIYESLYLNTSYSSGSIQFEGLDDFGYVYLMSAEGSDRIKIGFSENPLLREKQLNRGQSPYPIRVIYTTHAKRMARAEGFLKRAFAPKRAHGEWYELNSKDIEIIKSLQFV